MKIVIPAFKFDVGVFLFHGLRDSLVVHEFTSASS